MGVRIPALSGLISRAVVAVVAVASSFPFRLASPDIVQTWGVGSSRENEGWQGRRGRHGRRGLHLSL